MKTSHALPSCWWQLFSEMHSIVWNGEKNLVSCSSRSTWPQPWHQTQQTSPGLSLSMRLFWVDLFQYRTELEPASGELLSIMPGNVSQLCWASMLHNRGPDLKTNPDSPILGNYCVKVSTHWLKHCRAWHEWVREPPTVSRGGAVLWLRQVEGGDSGQPDLTQGDSRSVREKQLR